MVSLVFGAGLLGAAWYALFVASERKLNEAGDAFAPIAGILSFVALCAAIYSVFMQRKELELQRTELRKTKLELKRSADIQSEQREALKESAGAARLHAAAIAMAPHEQFLLAGARVGTRFHVVEALIRSRCRPDAHVDFYRLAEEIGEETTRIANITAPAITLSELSSSGEEFVRLVQEACITLRVISQVAMSEASVEVKREQCLSLLDSQFVREANEARRAHHIHLTACRDWFKRIQEGEKAVWAS